MNHEQLAMAALSFKLLITESQTPKVVNAQMLNPNNSMYIFLFLPYDHHVTRITLIIRKNLVRC